MILFLLFSFFSLLVDSNDILYGGDPDFLDDVSNLTSKVLRLLLENLSSLSKDPKRQANLCLELFDRMTVYADIEKMGKLVSKVWQLMLKYSENDSKFRVSKEQPVTLENDYAYLYLPPLEQMRMTQSLSSLPEEVRSAIESIQVKKGRE